MKFNLKAAADVAWIEAVRLLRERGDDPQTVLRDVAKVIDAWRAKPPGPVQ